MSRVRVLDRFLSWASSVVIILTGGAALAAGGAAILTGLLGAVLTLVLRVPQPWLYVLAVGIFLIAFVLLSATVRLLRAHHPSSWLFRRNLPDQSAQQTHLQPGGVAHAEWTTEIMFVKRDIRLALDSPPNSRIQGKTFDHCIFRGPAVILPVGQGNEFRGETQLHSEGRDVFWELPEDSVAKTGAIVVEDCVFNECAFIGVGLAGPLAFIREFAPQWHPKKHVP